jgi:N-acetylglucosaminyldiphosphoundecaprenol N-acetyl-beta-D-mannosaminyltransferase
MLEWLARLLIDPGRLWKRYILDNILFKLRFIKKMSKKRLLVG